MGMRLKAYKIKEHITKEGYWDFYKDCIVEGEDIIDAINRAIREEEMNYAYCEVISAVLISDEEGE